MRLRGPTLTLAGEHVVSVLPWDWVLLCMVLGQRSEERIGGCSQGACQDKFSPMMCFIWPMPYYNFFKLGVHILNFHIKIQTSGFFGKMENDNTESFLIPRELLLRMAAPSPCTPPVCHSCSPDNRHLLNRK